MERAQCWRYLFASLAFQLALWRAVSAASGSMSLYLHNAALDSDPNRARTNVAYYGEYFIGTPPKSFLGCFDTGSSDTWVPSVACTSDVCMSHDRYSASDSDSETNGTAGSVIIRYGTGSVAASLIYETVSMVGVTITNQGIAAASALTSDFSRISCDGLVGLGFSPLSSTGADPIFINAVNERNLTANLFTIWLSPDPGVEPAGEVTFGAINDARYSGVLQRIDLVREAYWEVVLDGVNVGTQTAGVASRTAIIDSGTTAIVVTTADAQAINSLIPGANLWEELATWNVSCDVSSLPDIAFVMGGTSFVVPPRLYVQRLTDRYNNPVGVCASAIVGGGDFSTSSGAIAILGTNFLRAWYTVYEVGTGNNPSQVGFAANVGRTTTGPSAGATGRKLKHDEPEALHTYPVHMLGAHKWGASARRRLSEGGAENPPLFTKKPEGVQNTRWGSADRN